MTLFESYFTFSVKEAANGVPEGTALQYQYPAAGVGTSPFGGSMKPDDIGAFCFPHLQSLRKVERTKSVYFAFVLTVEGGDRLYCFVKRVLPAGPGKRFDVDIVHVRQYIDPGSIERFLSTVNGEPDFAPGTVLRIRTPVCRVLCDYKITCPKPLDQGNPLLLFKYLTPRILHYLLGAVMCERRILFVGRDETQVSEAMFSLTALLFPFEWQHIFIPLLPDHLLEYTAAPAPYLVGALKTQMATIRSFPLGDVVVLDLTNNQLSVNPGGDAIVPFGLPITPIEDAVLEQEKLSLLVNQEITNISNKFRKIQKKGSEMSELEAFFKSTWLTFIVAVFNPLSKFLQRNFGVIPAGIESFIGATLDPDIRNFLSIFQHSQMFEVFVQGVFNEQSPNSNTIGMQLYKHIIQSLPPGSPFAQLRRTVANNVAPRSCVPVPAADRYVLDITSGNAGKSPEAQFADVARRSYDLLQCAGFRQAISRRLSDTAGRHWKYSLRSLTMIYFLLSAGCELVVAHCLDDMENIYRLVNFTTTALGVSDNAIAELRRCARKVYSLLNDLARLQGIRSPGGHVLLTKTIQAKVNDSVPPVAVLAGVDPGSTTLSFSNLNTALEPWVNLPPLPVVDLLGPEATNPFVGDEVLVPPPPPPPSRNTDSPLQSPLHSPENKLIDFDAFNGLEIGGSGTNNWNSTVPPEGPSSTRSLPPPSTAPPPLPVRPPKDLIIQAGIQRQSSAPQQHQPSRLLATRLQSKSPSEGTPSLTISPGALWEGTSSPLVPARLVATTTAASASQQSMLLSTGNNSQQVSPQNGVFNFDNVPIPQIPKRQSLPANMHLPRNDQLEPTTSERAFQQFSNNSPGAGQQQSTSFSSPPTPVIGQSSNLNVPTIAGAPDRVNTAPSQYSQLNQTLSPTFASQSNIQAPPVPRRRLSSPPVRSPRHQLAGTQQQFVSNSSFVMGEWSTSQTNHAIHPAAMAQQKIAIPNQGGNINSSKPVAPQANNLKFDPFA